MMAANKSVIVLVPNGRRQNVKVTPNTTILQVLEEVCQKHGYKAEDYDMKHYNQVLDANSIFRFTGLPNNAQLEMITCTKARLETDVTISIQLESGERVMGDFSPSDSLNTVLKNLCPNQTSATAVLIYMHREVYGLEALENTTLRSLGLSSGRAMLRLIHRDPGQPKVQAHVSAPLAPKPVEESKSSSNDQIPYRPPPTSKSAFQSQGHRLMDPVSLVRAEISNKQREEAEAAQLKPGREEPKETSKVEPLRKERDVEKMETTTIEEMNVEFLGDRNALVFNQAGAVALPRNELPDSFFDLTVDDAKTLLRDVKRQREQLDQAPLQTSAQRQLDQNKKTLQQLHKYRRSVIRVQFPDQMVLQGLFGPLETVQTVMDFVKGYLMEPADDFVLYTTPPRTVLNPDVRLIDADLVPSAILHYSGQPKLLPELQNKLTDPRAAGIQAVKSRMAMIREDSRVSSDDDLLPELDVDRSVMEQRIHEEPTPGPSSSAMQRQSQNQNKEQVPKWFKKTFK